eukprot:TRINITY_DN10787_c0_g1_i1.p1 TRINITY_DN10787_c0_g1~~TRINITY_DN10787_c0_g1_i1.p1  ORF type:complete len:265 (+),score=24.37 TRINITY_DN10787_c0_g1_i1:42-836(+)
MEEEATKPLDFLQPQHREEESDSEADLEKGGSGSRDRNNIFNTGSTYNNNFGTQSQSKVFSSASEFLNKRGFGWLVEDDNQSDGSIEEQTPLLEELDIDPKEILHKIRCIILPYKMNRSILLQSPDFWGPLAVVILYSISILWNNWAVLSWILTIWVVGSFVIFFLTRALGKEVTYGITLGVLGYCLLPELIVTLLLAVIGNDNWVAGLLKTIGVFWSSFSAGSLLSLDAFGQSDPTKYYQKQAMITYPILLLYVFFICLYSGV